MPAYAGMTKLRFVGRGKKGIIKLRTLSSACAR